MFNYIFVFVLALFVLLIVPPSVHAIIILPPIILLSIVHLVSFLIGVLAVPMSILSGVIIYLKKPENKKKFVLSVILLTVLMLVIIAVIVAGIIRIIQPERPWI
ncbi:MAG: hypothetical protein WCO06_01965 [Candidatus Roizmanbacteria bacterium]